MNMIDIAQYRTHLVCTKFLHTEDVKKSEIHALDLRGEASERILQVHDCPFLCHGERKITDAGLGLVRTTRS